MTGITIYNKLKMAVSDYIRIPLLLMNRLALDPFAIERMFYVPNNGQILWHNTGVKEETAKWQEKQEG